MSFSLTSNFLGNSRGFTFEDGGGITWSFNKNTNQITANGSGAGAGAANPTAKVGLAVVDGVQSTWMRSDAAPPVDQTIAPTWTGLHTFGAGLTISSGSFTLNSYTLTLAGDASVSGTNTGDQVIPGAANPSGTVGLAAVNGSATTFMRSDGAPALSQTISPTMSGTWTFSGSVTFSGTTVASPGQAANGAGYMGRPFNTQTGNYALVAGDRGKTIFLDGSSAQTLTVPESVFAAGDVVFFLGNNGNACTIAAGTGVTLLFANGALTTGNRTVTSYAYGTIAFLSATVAMISGSGIS